MIIPCSNEIAQKAFLPLKDLNFQKQLIIAEVVCNLYTSIHVLTCIVYVSTRICRYIHVHVQVCTYIKYMYMNVCACTCMYVYVCIVYVYDACRCAVMLKR